MNSLIRNVFSKISEIHLEHDDDDAERADVAGQSEHLDLLHDDWRTCRQELDQHDHRAVQVHVGVVQREFDEDRPGPDVKPVRRRHLRQLGRRHPRVTAEVEGVTATLK